MRIGWSELHLRASGQPDLLQLRRRLEPQRPPLRNLTLEHITIRGLAGTSHITTLPESPITVTCKDLSLSWRNGLPQTGVLRTSPPPFAWFWRMCG